MAPPATDASRPRATPSRSRTCARATSRFRSSATSTFTVRPGEVVALLGPNGAGKTTTLETIAGLNRPISGAIRMSGENIGGVPAHTLARRGLALVPEGRALFPGLTVREHLRLAGGRRGAGENELLEMLPELAQVPAPQGRPAVREASSRCWRSGGRSSPGRGSCSSTR